MISAAEQSIAGNLPPSIAALPAEIQRELLSLQTAPIKKLLERRAGQRLELGELRGGEGVGEVEQDHHGASAFASGVARYCHKGKAPGRLTNPSNS